MTSVEYSLWHALARAICGKEINLGVFDDDEILEQASLHGVSQLLNEQFKAGTITGVTDDTKDDLRSASLKSAALDMLVNTATHELMDLLAENKIPALLLKGTPVAHLYYLATYLRTRCDTDIFIHERDARRAADLLAENGFQLSGLGRRKISSKQFLAAYPTVHNTYLHFDVHWKPTNRVMFWNALPFDECLETFQAVPGLGPSAKTLSAIHLLIHACIHRIAHGRNTQRDRLIWLYDIHLVVESLTEAELAKFKSKVRQKQIAALCADALRVCCDIFGTDLPDGYLEELGRNCENEPSAKLMASSKLRWAWEDMRALGSIKEKVTFARELVFDR